MQRKSLEDMTFADDFIFAKVMSNADIAKDFLESLFSKQIESITLSKAQSEHKPGLDSHGARFDVEFIGMMKSMTSRCNNGVLLAPGTLGLLSIAQGTISLC